MVDTVDRQTLLTNARDALLDVAEVDSTDVPSHVAASWRRSASHGVLPSATVGAHHVDLDVQSKLVRCATPVIEQVLSQIAGTPMSVALTDHRARLLVRRDSETWIGRTLDTVCFAQGFGYAEGEVGTNGVGTVLEFGRSVHIVGAEHFVDALHRFACAGAPVRDPYTGRIVGVLDISCLSEHSTPLMHSLVRSAAAQIEQALLLDRNELQQALFSRYVRLAAHGREAVLAVGQRDVIANLVMQQLVDPGDRDALHEHVRFLMRRRAEMNCDSIDLPSGRQVRLRGSTVSVGDAVAGVVGVVSLLEERSGSAPSRSVRTGRRHPTSSIPAWNAAVAEVDAAVRAGHRLLVIGEAGSGRFELLDERMGDLTDVPVVAVRAEQLGVQSGAGLGGVIAPHEGPAWFVLRDVDLLTAAGVRDVINTLARTRVWFAATASDLARIAQPERDELLSQFRASVLVPPLRDRAGDLADIASRMLAELAPHRHVRLSPAACRAILRYEWPGNLAQLRDALSLALQRRPVGSIEATHLPEWCQAGAGGGLRRVDRVERDAIVAALRENDGNRVAAAAALGLARSTLYRKIHHYGITD